MKTELLQRIKAVLDVGIGPGEENELGHALYASRYPDGVIRCPSCKSEKVYQLADNRYRCGSCKYTYGPFTGTWLGSARISLEAWLILLGAFADDLTTQEAVRRSGLSFPTVLRVFHIIRKAIAVSEEPLLVDTGDGAAPATNSRHKDDKDISAISPRVFGLVEHGQAIGIALLPEMSLEDLLRQPVRFVKKGGLIYTDALMYYGALLTYVAAGKAKELENQSLFTRGLVSADRQGGFMPFLRQSLNKHHRIDEDKFPFYLYESRYRYLHHNTLFEKVLLLLNQAVPEV